MSDQIREQVSAFLDGELPGAETELLLKRLMRDADLRASFGRYAMIGEACRSQKTTHLTVGFASKVRGAIDGEALVVTGRIRVARKPRWWRHAASGAVAAGVAVVAVFALQQRANTPTVTNMAASVNNGAAAGVLAAANPRRAFVPTSVLGAAPALPTALPVVAARNHEPLSYTVPATLDDIPANLPSARLTNYVFAHSEFGSLLGQRNMLSGLIAEPDEQWELVPVDHQSAARPAQAPDSNSRP